MAPLTSPLIRSSSPRIQKSARLFVFRQLGHAVVLCLLVSLLFPGFWVLVLLAARGASVQPQVYLFLHSCFCQCENKAAAAPVTAAASSKTCSTPTLQISPEASPFLFAFLAVVQLCYFASYLSHSPSVSAPLAPPTSIKFHLLCASRSYVVVLLYGFASYSVIKAPLCAQPRTAVF